MNRLPLAGHSLTIALLTLAATTMGCAALPADTADAEEAEASEAAASSIVAKPEILPGKYVANGQMLMIYGRCAQENFLGSGGGGSGDLGIDGRTISVEEGNVCRSYRLTPTGPGLVEVTWNKPADAHLGAAVEESCRSLEGSYAMTVSSPYRDVTAGTYKGPEGMTLEVPAGCGESTLGKRAQATYGHIVPRATGGRSKPFFKVEEGNVCRGYVIDILSPRSVKVTWAPPVDAVLGDEVTSSCQRVEGIYTR